mgnify:CR=1 FL=1
MRFEEYFSGGASLFITIKGEDKEEMVACAEALVAEFKARTDLRQYIRASNLKLDEDFIRQWGFMLQEADDLADLRERFVGLIYCLF